MKQIKLLKWASTVAVLTGIVLTNLNIFPLNIIIHGSGALGWTIAGYLTKDRALLTNFCYNYQFLPLALGAIYLPANWFKNRHLMISQKRIFSE